MLFNKQDDIKTSSNQDHYAETSAFGRALTSIPSAKEELFHQSINFNPLKYILEDKYFMGLDHFSKEALYNDESIHTQVVAPTRCGKGIFIGVKVIEAIRRNKGCIIIDPKEDDYLVSIIKEELERLNKKDNLEIINWPNDFGYTVFSHLDSIEEATKKMSIMLNLIENENDLGASFYRKNERIILSKVMCIFFNTKYYLDVDFKLSLSNLSIFLKYIINDLISHYEFQKEYEKRKPNFDKLEKLSVRYFNPELFSKIDINYSKLSTLESLQFSISEFDNIAIYDNYHIVDALCKGRILYVKSDMLDETALKFLKLIITDVIQLSKKHKNETNCLVILDELSFYPTSILTAGLATAAGFGINFILAYQSEGQMKDENLKVSIKDNCQTKIYYKTSDDKTLKYIELLSGLELVSQATIKGNELTIRQMQEPHMNISRLRALPRARVAILLDENLNEIKIFQTAPIPVKNKFEWDDINRIKVSIKKLSLIKEHKLAIEQNNTSRDKIQPSKKLIL